MCSAFVLRTTASLCSYPPYIVSLISFYRKGFPEDRIKAVLHHIERGIKYQSTNFGLTLVSVCNVMCTCAYIRTVCLVCI